MAGPYDMSWIGKPVPECYLRGTCDLVGDLTIDPAKVNALINAGMPFNILDPRTWDLSPPTTLPAMWGGQRAYNDWAQLPGSANAAIESGAQAVVSTAEAAKSAANVGKYVVLGAIGIGAVVLLTSLNKN